MQDATATAAIHDPPPLTGGKTPEGGEGLRSPGLNHFRRNPFRLLRLAFDATTDEAIWRGEKTLALLRAEVPPPEPDVLPWLPGADELEIRQSVQRMEEPLRRLVDELAWFDFAGDPAGEALREALIAEDAAALAAYLGKTDVEGVAHALNQANLRLVLGFSALHGLGPSLGRLLGYTVEKREGTAGSNGSNGHSQVSWRQAHGLTLADDPHLHFVSGAGDDPHHAWRSLLPEGFGRWSKLTAHPGFADYVKGLIRQLGDDMVGEDDVESLTNAVTTALADLIAGEIKLLMIGGRLDQVAALADVATRSGIDAQLWVLSFRPLRSLFESELAELSSLVDENTVPDLENIDLYLKRLEGLRRRWRTLDAGDLLGLAEIVDRAVERAFDRLRNISEPALHAAQFEATTRTARDVACSAYLKERIDGYLKQFGEYRARALCTFCKRREQDPDSAVMVTGQKVTHVERIYNGTRTHYALRGAPVPRCAPCAEFQLFTRKIDLWIQLAFLPIPLIALSVFDLSLEGFAFACLCVGGAGFLASEVMKLVIGSQAKGFTEQIDVKQTEPVRDLQGEGFSITKIDLSKNAAAAWTASARANASNISGALAMKLVYLGLGVALLLLRACGRH